MVNEEELIVNGYFLIVNDRNLEFQY